MAKLEAAMRGIQFVTDGKGRKTAVLIDLKKHGAAGEDFCDGLISESRGKEKTIPYEPVSRQPLETQLAACG